MDGDAAQRLPADCAEWDEVAWLAYFEASRDLCYIFDFRTAPKVKGDSFGFADAEGRLVLVADIPCPECFRPTLVLLRRWENEPRAQYQGRIEARMRELNWHALHPQRQRATDGIGTT